MAILMHYFIFRNEKAKALVHLDPHSIFKAVLLVFLGFFLLFFFPLVSRQQRSRENRGGSSSHHVCLSCNLSDRSCNRKILSAEKLAETPLSAAVPLLLCMFLVVLSF